MTITLVGILLFVWSVGSIQLSGIASTDVSGSQLIREWNPLRLISPEWVSPKGDMFEWLRAETRARMALVICALGVTVGILIWRRAREKGNRLEPPHLGCYDFWKAERGSYGDQVC